MQKCLFITVNPRAYNASAIAESVAKPSAHVRFENENAHKLLMTTNLSQNFAIEPECRPYGN